MKKSNLITIAAISAALILATGCKGKEAATTPTLKSVKTAKAVSSTIGLNVQYPAKLKPAEEITVSPKASGRVESVNFDVGAIVKKGDVLFTIESREARAQLAQAEAALKTAEANLERTTGYLNLQQLSAAEQGYKQAKVQYDDAKRNYDKIADAYGQVQVGKQEMNDAESKLKNATTQLETARVNFESLSGQGIPESTAAAKAQYEQAQAAVNLSRVTLENYTVRSPIDGKALSKSVDAGELASMGAPAFTIINNAAIDAEVSVPYSIVKNIKVAQKVNIISTDEKTFEGEVTKVAPSSDSKTQFYAVTIEVTGHNNELRSGGFAKAVFQYEKSENTVAVPINSVIFENGIQFIFKANGGIINKVQVKTGVSDGTKVEVLEGLVPGDLVAVEGQSFLTEGEKVNVVE